MQSSRPLATDELDRPIRLALPQLGRGAASLSKLGISTPREALWYLPFRYDDFSDLRTLDRLVPDEKQSARVRVEAVRFSSGMFANCLSSVALLSASPLPVRLCSAQRALSTPGAPSSASTTSPLSSAKAQAFSFVA